MLLKSRSIQLFIALAFLVILGGMFDIYFSAEAAPDLTITPLTWNIIGLDSNRPAEGPRHFPVAARICSPSGTAGNPVIVDFVWDDADATYIYTRPGSLTQLTFPALNSGECADAYFEVEVNPVAAAFNQSRAYHITATSGADSISTPQPRELFVEHLISQNRNATTDMRYGTTAADLQSVPPGGSMNLLVGETYLIELTGGTATQGYEQFEQFITLTNTVFQINSVTTDYAVNSSPYVGNPSDMLYADACLWDNDPASPNYRACLDSGYKTGGAPVVVTYNVTILSGGGTTQTLNSLLYDFSGSSYHYNSDFSASARFANIIEPTSADIAKRFVPDTISAGGVSTLVFTLTNPNAGVLSGYNFEDTLPSGVIIADPPSASTSGCGTPTLVVNPNGSTILFENGTVAGNSSCTISVNVTAASTGSYVNITDNLFIGTIDTGNSANDTLTVSNAPPPPACTPGIELARWTMDPAQGTGVPPVASYVSSQVGFADATFMPSALPGVNDIFSGNGNPINSWRGTGWLPATSPDVTTGPGPNDASYFQFDLDTSAFNGGPVQISIDVNPSPTGNWATPSNITANVHASVDGGPYTTIINQNPVSRDTWSTLTGSVTPGATNTTFRVNISGRSNGNPDATFLIDNIVFTGCGIPDSPTMTKTFSPDRIAAGTTATLTFTLHNPNASVPLTGAAFTDDLPAGMTVASPPNAISNCGGNWSYSGGESTLNFSNGTIPANSSCTLVVDVTSSMPGPSTNVSGFLSTTETGTNDGPGGSATDTLTVLSPPQIDKLFSPNPIVENGVSTLVFTIINPNVDETIDGVAFADTFPGGVIVATPPNETASASCGGGVWAPIAGANSVTFSDGVIAGGESCTLTVNVTASTAGNYPNTSSNVSHQVNGQTVNGNTASDTLMVNTPIPNVSILKQVGASPAGPWTPYMAVEPGDSVYYFITIENTGEAALSPVTVTDVTVDLSGCVPWTDPLPVADAQDDDHIDTCVVGPVAASATSGNHSNTAQVSAGGLIDNDSAIYATADLGLTKAPSPTTYTTAGETITYTFTVTNSANSATLRGPVTINDPMVPDASCPVLSSVGDGDDFLDPGESIDCTGTYVTTSADVSAGSVTNTATASVGGVISPEASATVTTPVTTGISVTKSAAPDNVPEPGDTVTFTVGVTNTGSVEVSLTSLVDDVHGDLNGQGDCVLPQTIAASDTYTCSFTAFVGGNAGDTETDTVTASGTSNGNPVNDSASATVTVGDVVPTITTSKTPNPDNVNEPGGTVIYTVVVSNTGTAESVTLTGLNDTVFGDVADAGNAALDATTCAVPQTIAAGDVYNCTFTVTLTGQTADSSPHSNTVTATVTDDENNVITAAGSADVTINTPEIEVTKTATLFVDNDGDNQVDPGDTLRYTVEITNTGSADAVSIVFTDIPDANTALVEGSVTTTQGTVTSGNGAGETTVGVDVGTITFPGGTVTIIFDVTVNNPLPQDVSEVSNQGVVSGDNFPDEPTDDPDTPADDDPTIVSVGAAPEINAVKTATLLADNDADGLVDPGDTLEYTVEIGNTGTTEAVNVVFSDSPDANTTLMTGSVTTTQGTVTSGNGAGETAVGVDVGTIAAPDGNVTITFQVIVNTPFPTDIAEVSNQGVISGENFSDELTDDPDTPVEGDPTITSIGVVPLIEASKAVVLLVDDDADGEVDPDETLHYTVEITNTGSADASGVIYADAPDANTTLLVGSVTTSQGTITSGNGAGDATVEVDLGTLAAPDGVVTITYVVNVNSPLPESVTELANQGVVSGDNVEDTSTDDPTTPDADDPTIIAIGAPPPPPPNVPAEPEITFFDPAISKVGELEPGQLGLPGENLTWVMSITNVGNAPGTDVVITDTLQPELQITNVTIDMGTTSVAGQTVEFYIPILNPGQTVMAHIYTKVLQSPLEGEFFNTVTLAGTGPDNDIYTAEAAAVVSAPASLPNTGYPPANAQSSAATVPTMLVIGLVGLVGCLLVAGWLFHRKA